MQAHALGEVGILGTVLLRVYSGTLLPIFIEIAELHREFRQPLHAAYIDIKAAFDSVDRQALWKALHENSVKTV